ncbi:N-acetylmuramoyl-L-alanine amidase [Lachnospiraceae bacterium OttesenSCG-928-E19]|nr:N-acetylmuramoyl-L-alanine amidase [Lachnospiraceae bacterium OttesenSCG-928-E19]
MNVTRRTVLKIAGGGALVISFFPRMAFAAPNKLKSLRTGVQPGNKTRLVIETSARPSYTLSYPQNKLVVTLSNTSANNSVSAKLASGTLISSVGQTQIGDKLEITAHLNKSIATVPKGNIMVLSPNGDNDYRLVIDFVAGTGATTSTTTATAAATTKPTNNTNAAPAKKHVIVIDAGHGGKDPGCIGQNGTKEKTIVLSIAKKLKTKLDAAGYKTYLTRSTDVFLNLDTRANIAEKNHADLFLSLHANANPSRAMKGFSIYTLSKKASDEEARKLAEAENAVDKIDVDKFERYPADIRSALSSLQQHALAEMSMEYARGCAKSFKNAKITQQAGPDVRQAPFAVLRGACTGALLELGHLSNSAEEKLLNTASHQDKLVNAIVKSVNSYDFED